MAYIRSRKIEWETENKDISVTSVDIYLKINQERSYIKNYGKNMWYENKPMHN